ncbi:AraC family transcriptional regulator [bacterium]|nr:AraC family transcriptional regulator [bacterium]
MISIPAPFVVAMLLAVLVVVNHNLLRESSTGILFAVVLWLFVATEVVIGLRWLLDSVALMSIVAVSSITGIIILYLAFASLGRRGPAISWTRDWPHSLPIVLILGSVLTFIQWVEIVIVVTKLVYAGFLIQQARKAPDSLQFVRLGWLRDTHRALWCVSLFLLFSALVDVAIIIDFALNGGKHSARLVGYANLIILIPMGIACVIAGGESVSKNRDESLERAELPQSVLKEKILHPKNNKISQRVDESDDAETALLLVRLNELLVNEKLFSDTELSLQRLARKAGVPSRSVSRAINSQTGLNMSRWVNNARVNAVCELLKQSDISIAQAMFESGFTTKSNFNREFRRVKGSSPSVWRDQHRLS